MILMDFYDPFCSKDGERSADVINTDIDKVIAKHIPSDMNMHLHMFVVPLRTIHLEHSDVKRTILILSLLGFAILFCGHHELCAYFLFPHFLSVLKELEFISVTVHPIRLYFLCLYMKRL